MDIWQLIGEDIFNATGIRLRDGRASIGGGDINQAVRLQGEGRDFFVKTNTARGLAMFEAEVAGLRELAASNTVRVPEPICCGVANGHAYLVMEFLNFSRSGDAALLGRQLAAMHRVSRKDFGWDRDNTIGSTPQINTSHNDWVAFWRERRLRFQFDLARDNGCSGNLSRHGEELLDGLDSFFSDYRPQPALLHGDLWSGNHGYLRDGAPVIFDPAVYYGDREADIAMTELFGGFSADFYAGYREAWPLDAGYGVRKHLYNLYHVLNHFNMFGGSYQGQAQQMCERLLAELH
ncbi:MAG: fructosamine kinase family protein [Gammaproteobacteria bacterium]|nr:fructosamine kinase family protein [Gammaproteobacteria bacterium]MBU2478095.1 fructosamine kinase family protein [Gammaproteobacteria bacterium]